ncbi:hypothetical protein EV356DRAFT_529224 [Viridothelium virens]|uniref:Uncharacterized protein n=1 Tax=Viridothelium virens TaxID=1048519 RepID=A0A6A6HL23_VIRVR|nr:hypothetical protein EV356DRAFT_529224 [Viridothelium virens]
MDRGQSKIAQDSDISDVDVAPHQHLRERGRTPSPPWKSRCFVYDCGNVELEVMKKEKIEGHEEKQRYQKIQLRPRQRHVALFVESETENGNTDEGETRLMTEEETKEAKNRVLFATLDLKGAGLFDKLHMLAGKLTTLYVFNIGKWQEARHSSSCALSSPE